MRGQQEIVAQCSSPRSDPELKANLAAYLEKFPGIPEKVAFEDTSIAKMAVAVAGEAPHSGAPAPAEWLKLLSDTYPSRKGCKCTLTRK